MTSFSRIAFSCLAVGGLICSTTGLTLAQDSDSLGIVRISDGPAHIEAQGAPGSNRGVTQVNCQNCQTGQGYANSGYGAGCPNCQYGTCQHGMAGGCPYGCNNWVHTQHVHAMLDWFNPYGACTHSPDHGYAPPIKSPVYRRGVAYTKYFPDAWMGIQSGDAGGQRAPLVYMPTDTTQLGYYYQHTPRWMPVRGMVPPAPTPNQWHFTCHDKNYGMCQNGNCPQDGGIVVEGAAVESNQGIPGNVIEVQPNAAPIESAPAAPVAPGVTPPAPATPAPAPAVQKASLNAPRQIN